jgi:hypothetical protein
LGRKVLEGVATVATNCLLLASDRDETLAVIGFGRCAAGLTDDLFFLFFLVAEVVV